VYKQVGAYAVAEVFIFVGILLFALACVWRRGALEWQ
jgi:NADH:ubiquinone oxidoreductase subunit 3 (subunit A)